MATDLEVIAPQGVAQRCVRGAVVGLIAWHPWAPALLQLDDPLRVAFIALGALRASGQEVAGRQVAVSLAEPVLVWGW